MFEGAIIKETLSDELILDHLEISKTARSFLCDSNLTAKSNNLKAR